jgi:hypothetical protein
MAWLAVLLLIFLGHIGFAFLLAFVILIIES